MEVLVALGYVLVTGTMIGVTVYNVLRSARRDHGLPGFTEGAEATPDRLASLLAAASRRVARVVPYTLGEMDTGLRFTIEGLCPSVTVWRQGEFLPGPHPHRVSIGDGRALGEPDFDRAFRVAGTPSDVLALLSASTRSALREILLGNVRIGQLRLEAGTLVVDVPTAGFAREHPGLEQAARAVARLSTLLGTPLDAVARLADNVTQDPQPVVRAQSLLALKQAHGSDPRTRAVVTAALDDANERVRLEAALASGERGRDTLIALALDPAVEDDVAERALDALGTDLPLDRVEPLVRGADIDPEAARAQPLRTRAFLAALGRNPSAAALTLLQRLGRNAADAYGPAVVEAIVTGGRTGAEAALLALLAPASAVGLLAVVSDRRRTQEAAARRLGAVGTVDAVLPLRAAERHGGAIASAARQSVAEIQERLAGSKGRLALTDTEAGRLSEATDETGHVSLPRDDS
jgi:hypothetical protein